VIGRSHHDLQVFFGPSDRGAKQRREAQHALDRLMLPKS
jgi:hypothetical protein